MDRHSYPKLKPGDSFDHMPIHVWNELIDLLARSKQTYGFTVASEVKPPNFRECNAITIRNATEDDHDIGDILAISGSVYDPAEESELASFKFAPILRGIDPAFPDHIGRFVILLEPIRSGSIGNAVLSGMAWCKVEMDFRGRPFADIDPLGSQPTTRLVGNEYGGAEILYIEDEDKDPEEWTAGTKNALVRLGSFNSPDLVVSWDGDLEFGMENEAFVHDASGPTERTIPLWASLITSSGGGITAASPPLMAWAHFHRESGLFELGANSYMMTIPPP